MQCLIWVSTVCLCPTKRTPGLYGLVFVSTAVEIVDYLLSGNIDLIFQIVLIARYDPNGNPDEML